MKKSSPVPSRDSHLLCRSFPLPATGCLMLKIGGRFSTGILMLKQLLNNNLKKYNSEYFIQMLNQSSDFYFSFNIIYNFLFQAHTLKQELDYVKNELISIQRENTELNQEKLNLQSQQVEDFNADSKRQLEIQLKSTEER